MEESLNTVNEINKSSELDNEKVCVPNEADGDVEKKEVVKIEVNKAKYAVKRKPLEANEEALETELNDNTTKESDTYASLLC